MATRVPGVPHLGSADSHGAAGFCGGDGGTGVAVMTAMRASLACPAFCIAIALGSAVARAQPASHDDARRPADAPETKRSLLGVPLRLEGSLAVVRAQDAGWAPGLRGTGLLLLGPVELGVSAAVESQLFGYSREGVSALAGLRALLDDVELDAAASVGIAHTHTEYDWLFGGDPGASGTLEFVGARAGITWLPLRAANHLHRAGFALSAAYERDLHPYRVTYSYDEASLFGDGEFSQTKTRTIGTQRLSLLAALVLAFD